MNNETEHQTEAASRRDDRDCPSGLDGQVSRVRQTSVPRTAHFRPAYGAIPSRVRHEGPKASKKRLCAKVVHVRLGRKEASLAAGLKRAGVLPNLQELAKEIIRGDYIRLAAGGDGRK